MDTWIPESPSVLDASRTMGMGVQARIPREDSSHIIHPQILRDGSVVYLEAQIRDRLQNGAPDLGWEGDPRLEVYQGPDRRLYVWRLESDGEYRMVCRSRPDLPLDERLIRSLVAHDVRRGYNPKESVDRHNRRLEKELDEAGDAALSEAKQKVYHALKKDLGATL